MVAAPLLGVAQTVQYLGAVAAVTQNGLTKIVAVTHIEPGNILRMISLFQSRMRVYEQMMGPPVKLSFWRFSVRRLYRKAITADNLSNRRTTS